MFEFLKKKPNAKDVQTPFNKANDDILNDFKGKQFPEGALTIFREEDLPKWHKNVSEAFPAVGVFCIEVDFQHF